MRGSGAGPRGWAFVAALFLGALSLAPSYAHLLEAPPRLLEWSPELWRETTVFNAQFVLFAKAGAPVELGCILATASAAWTARGRRPAFRLAVLACLLFATALGLWLAIVAPANAVLATWTPGPIPPDFAAVRARWEGGHITIAVVKLLAFLLLAVAAVRAGGRRPRSDSAEVDKGTVLAPKRMPLDASR